MKGGRKRGRNHAYGVLRCFTAGNRCVDLVARVRMGGGGGGVLHCSGFAVSPAFWQHHGVARDVWDRRHVYALLSDCPLARQKRMPPRDSRQAPYGGYSFNVSGRETLQNRVHPKAFPSQSDTTVFLADRRAGSGGGCRASRVRTRPYPKSVRNPADTTAFVYHLPLRKHIVMCVHRDPFRWSHAYCGTPPPQAGIPNPSEAPRPTAKHPQPVSPNE